MATKEIIKEREKEKMMSDVIGRSPAGAIEKIPNMKKRQRAIYYRPVIGKDGSVDWVATKLLPSDALGRELYLSKGFKLSLPSTDTATPEQVESEQEKEVLLAENTRLRQELNLAKARQAKKDKT